MQVLRGIFSFFRRNVVMTVALLAAIITGFIVPPDNQYIGYLMRFSNNS